VFLYYGLAGADDGTFWGEVEGNNSLKDYRLFKAVSRRIPYASRLTP
jgi:hypothetical protein